MPAESSSTLASRSALAAQQARLIEALKSGKNLDDFDQAKLCAASTALAAKRLQSARKTWPAFAQSIGVSFAQEFASYALEHPSPPPDGPRSDITRFALWLQQKGRLSDSAQLEISAWRVS